MTNTTQRPGREQSDPRTDGVTGEFVTLDGEETYRISNVHLMVPFLMTLVSDSDHWMYVSSEGGLAAGRVQPEQSLFPYETDDRLYRAGRLTGPMTLLRVTHDGAEPTLWEPFTGRLANESVRRNLYKTTAGNSILFEEVNGELGLTFRYRWNTSETYGFVRTATLLRHDGSGPVHVDVLDGLLNLMPANVPLGLQQSTSTLIEAYRRNEIDVATGMAVYSLESRISDRAEPAESLRANVAWNTGLEGAVPSLSADVIRAFRAGRELPAATITKGQRGHYLLRAGLDLDDGAAQTWRIVADVHRSQADVVQLRAQLESDGNIADDIAETIAQGAARLAALLGSADASQSSGDEMAAAHHLTNTLFNCMRGGVFVDGATVPVNDFVDFLETRNRPVRRAHAEWLASLGSEIGHGELLAAAAGRNDPDLERLCHEYLPLTFSRRHGDPSRPWNRFAIHVKDEDGNPILNYQGNWRDIFQNWEALCYSFPHYFESIIAKFVNASTVDGFNPYRLTRDGFDWEVPEPDNPWSNIGYWGDHQIVYLLRLLEASHAFHPNALTALMAREIFSYANVPYQLRPYEAIVRDNKHTIDYDRDRAKELDDLASIVGSDGKLVRDADGEVYHVNLAEKLVVPLLAKLANLVVDAGIWMNTQRPEWNDANNALVGNGVSMVTLAYVRRYLDFVERIFSELADDHFTVSVEVGTWLGQTIDILSAYRDRLDSPLVGDRRRKRLLDRLGSAFSDYRATVYERGFSGRTAVSVDSVVDLCRVAREYADHSIRANRREDGLYHAYNLLEPRDEDRELGVGTLPEMLEGQVAIISSGLLTSDEVLRVVDALFSSRLYREDQQSFTLYPNRELGSFLAKNVVPARSVENNPLLVALLSAGDASVIVQDAAGNHRFTPEMTSHSSLAAALDALGSTQEWAQLVATNRDRVHSTYEAVFNHAAFTGRSGSMYKYEGLGSIYWHMVAKLLLAVQEAYWKARAAGEPEATLTALADAYYRVRSGLSSDKTPAEYGAFPADAYSHTPGHMGAQQPGMTGQVKEEVLTRWGELGLRVEGSALSFEPALLRRREFATVERSWTFHDVSGTLRSLELPGGSVAFTYCQVPVVYQLGAGEGTVTVAMTEGATETFPGSSLDRATSDAVWERRGTVSRIDVVVPESMVDRE